jgi:hypothetical protein
LPKPAAPSVMGRPGTALSAFDAKPRGASSLRFDAPYF